MTGRTEHTDPIWWTDARADPWRDPTTVTEIVVPGPAPPRPAAPVEATPAGGASRVRLLPVLVITAVLAGVAGGAIGGLLGYTYAEQDPPAGTALGVGVGATPGAEPAPVAQPPGSLADVVERVLPSVVTIRADGPRGGTLGSGFLLSYDGHVLTNDHVVGTSTTPPTVTFHDGDTAQAELVGRDPESDLAVLRVDPTGTRPVRLGDSSEVSVGDQVLAFGSPLALANTVTSGIVSAVDRTIRAGESGEPTRYYAAIQTDAAVNQGNSGGPLVDATGRVIGVNSVIKSLASTAQEAGNIGLAFAIPINQAIRVASEIIDRGVASRTVIGAELRAAPGSTGVLLATVVPDGPADRAGLREGDVVVRFDGQLLAEPADLIALVRRHSPGSVVPVDYRRGGAESTVTVTLAADDG